MRGQQRVYAQWRLRAHTLPGTGELAAHSIKTLGVAPMPGTAAHRLAAPLLCLPQADAVNLLAGAKTQHHPENTVGVMTMAGKTPQVRRWRVALPAVAPH